MNNKPMIEEIECRRIPIIAELAEARAWMMQNTNSFSPDSGTCCVEVE
jgi:hypothetical protein